MCFEYLHILYSRIDEPEKKKQFEHSDQLVSVVSYTFFMFFFLENARRSYRLKYSPDKVCKAYGRSVIGT